MNHAEWYIALVLAYMVFLAWIVWKDTRDMRTALVMSLVCGTVSLAAGFILSNVV